MTLVRRLCLGVSALVCAASLSTQAWAEAPRPLSDRDARAYAQAFEAADAGDFVGAQIQASEVKDTSLLGYLSFRQLMHPTAHKASFEELSSWLAKFRDLPLADRIFSLAAKRKPADAKDPPAPELAGIEADPTRPAREAFYSGDPQRAFYLAVAAGERWVAGLSAYRLRDYAEAQVQFADLARDPQEDPWLRSAAAFWAGRAAAALGDSATSRQFVQMAAEAPNTFYGMIAARQLQLAVQAAEAAPTGRVVLASYRPQPKDPQDLSRFVSANPRAHRAAALAQIGRIEEARAELRAGLASAATPQDREGWSALIAALGPARQPTAAAGPTLASLSRPQPGYTILGSDYPIPPLEPKWGFTVDKALVYALVYQESRFNPQAVSPVGAVGLMQLMPETAARTAGDDKLRKDHTPLFDPAFNLRVGQDYLTWLMERGVGYDLLRTVAAYNGGPGAVLKAVSHVGDDDPLMLIECLPAQETRNYVEKVMAAYWTYKRMFGEEARSLDALAMGARRIDPRMDLANPNPLQPQAPSQTIQVGHVQGAEPASLD